MNIMIFKIALLFILLGLLYYVILYSRAMSILSQLDCQCTSESTNVKLLKDTLLLKSPMQNLTIFETLKARHPNIPLEFSMQTPQCNLLPSPTGIRWVNTIWQQYSGPSGHLVYLYSAFYDNRIKNELRPSVSVLGMSSEPYPDVGWCHLWVDASKPPLVAKVIKTEYIDYQVRESDIMKPYLFSCKVPSVDGIQVKPYTVSLVAKPCDPATNLIQVNGDSVRNISIAKEFDESGNQSGLWNTAVCAPALYFYNKDFSLRLIEWFEVLKALGISKVFIYETDVHPNIEKVLKHYEAVNYIQVTKYTYPPPYTNDPSLRRIFSREGTPQKIRPMFALENVYFTDCVLRHMHEYRFIAHFDPDELPILIKHQSFPKLVDELLRNHTGSSEYPVIYKLSSTYFYDNIPPPPSVTQLPANLWDLRHAMHNRDSDGLWKSIYDMDTVATVYSHGAMTTICNNWDCHTKKEYEIPVEVAYLGHFKHICNDECKKKQFFEETAYKNIRSKVQVAVSQTIALIGLSLENEDSLRQWQD